VLHGWVFLSEIMLFMGCAMNLNRDQEFSIGLVILFLDSILVLWAALQGPLAS
jgi:hypothetical protein